MTARLARPDELPACLEVRREVFIEGQGVPEARERDGLDPQATHFAIERDGAVVGTARLRIVDGHGKAERVAVRAAWRGHGLGAALMHALEAEAAARGCDEVLLHAQIDVVPFYERLGYAPEGPLFVDAGIQHRAMRKHLG